jgi:acetyl-CoA acetyltransferase
LTPQRSGEFSSDLLLSISLPYEISVDHGEEMGEEGEILNRADNSDIAVGNVLPPGGGANVARMAQLYSGIPYT